MTFLCIADRDTVRFHVHWGYKGSDVRSAAENGHTSTVPISKCALGKSSPNEHFHSSIGSVMVYTTMDPGSILAT